MSSLRHLTIPMPPRIHVLMVAAVTFFALLVSAGLRATPGVLMLPLQINFGWDRAIISFAAAVGIFLYGLVGPFAAALMISVGIRRTMLGGLGLMAGATLASLWMRVPWQYVLTWGVLSGIGSGAVASVLGAAVVNRWFATRQGLVMGLLSASTATGALIFLPFLAWLSGHGEWRPVVLTVSLACLILVPVIAFVVPEHPGDIGTQRFGESPDSAPPPPLKQARTAGYAVDVLFRAARDCFCRAGASGRYRHPAMRREPGQRATASVETGAHGRLRSGCAVPRSARLLLSCGSIRAISAPSDAERARTARHRLR